MAGEGYPWMMTMPSPNLNVFGQLVIQACDHSVPASQIIVERLSRLRSQAVCRGIFEHRPYREVPGVVRGGLTVQTICATKWGTDERHVTSAMKRQVFQSYHVTGIDDLACVADDHGARREIDHLISRELGGADDVKNLWPQPYGSKPWNARLKDRVENRLNVEICHGWLSLNEARRPIPTDWREAYKRYFGEP
jgi:hypothetical protein